MSHMNSPAKEETAFRHPADAHACRREWSVLGSLHLRNGGARGDSGGCEEEDRIRRCRTNCRRGGCETDGGAPRKSVSQRNPPPLSNDSLHRPVRTTERTTKLSATMLRTRTRVQTRSSAQNRTRTRDTRDTRDTRYGRRKTTQANALRTFSTYTVPSAHRHTRARISSPIVPHHPSTCQDFFKKSSLRIMKGSYTLPFIPLGFLVFGTFYCKPSSETINFGPRKGDEKGDEKGTEKDIEKDIGMASCCKDSIKSSFWGWWRYGGWSDDAYRLDNRHSVRNDVKVCG